MRSFEYFNLRNMRLCYDALEIEYEHDTLEKCINDIIAYIKNNVTIEK